MRLLLLLSACLIGQSVRAQSVVPLREPWEARYQTDDARGSHVLGLWSFDGEDPELDDSSHRFSGKLENATVDRQGRFGACLRTARGWPLEDKRHRLLVRHNSALNPSGPFTIELWINGDETLTEYPDAFLVDKKYVADSGYQLILQRPDRNGLRTLKASLGFGSRSASWYSRPLDVAPGSWYHLAFSYDAVGTGTFFVNGQLWGVQHVEGVDRISPGTHPLSIGDRVGSLYHGFPGRIDQVRLTTGAREFRPVRLECITDRANFLRMEKGVSIRFQLRNVDRQDICDGRLVWILSGRDLRRSIWRR